ncbi:M20 family metallopeptidase [Amycolatopsis thailandensis]|uniref:M20 family metallopeptidase n=1 Tax=Amycolatopsis thailandensis TaxID=589330 RepID=UPI0036315269
MNDDLKTLVRKRIAHHREDLIAASADLHAKPELAFEEHFAAERLTTLLEEAGFDVERGIHELPTAFRATFGEGEFTIGICAEYDALPDIGHACGHNLIAAMSVGAALGASSVAERLGVRIQVLGTPAEEQGAGKVLLLERGAFDPISVAMMAHPASDDQLPQITTSKALSRLSVEYTGRTAHAGYRPEDGINAADAATIAQVALGLARQQTPPGHRLASLVREAGQSTNIIPDRAVVEAELRAPTSAELAVLRKRAVACFEAGAVATGAEVRITATQPDLAELRQDPWMSDRYADNLRALGRNPGPAHEGAGFSTDMGNVSQVIPSIHPLIGILGVRSQPHTRGFAEATVGPAAEATIVDGATALAWTAVDLGHDHEIRRRYSIEHRQRRDAG